MIKPFLFNLVHLLLIPFSLFHLRLFVGRSNLKDRFLPGKNNVDEKSQLREAEPNVTE